MATPLLTDDVDALELRLAATLDPIRNYKPWPTQARCYASRARYRYIGGANRRGKTAHLVVELCASALRVHPTKTVTKNVTFLVLAPSREQLQDPWEVKLLKNCEFPGFEGRPMIPPEAVKKVWRTHGAGAPTLRQIDLKNGNCLKFGVSKDPESWKRKAGTALFAIILDESEGDVNLLAELYPRLLDANKDEDIVREAGGGWLLWGATATTANRALMKFIENCKNPELPDWEGFEFGEDEGSANDKSERERLRGAFDEDDFELRMTGKARFIDRLLIYGNDWDETVHIAREDYVIQDSDNIWCAYDPGGAGKESHDTGIMFAAINKDKPRLLRIVKYIKLNRTTLGYDMKRVAHFLRGRALEGFIPDPAVNKTEKGSGKTVRAQIQEAMAREKIVSHCGLPHILNRHDPGIMCVKSYFEQELIQFNPSKESGCQIAVGQIVSYRSYEAGVYQGIRGVVKVDDEAPDDLRYLCMRKPMWMPRPCGKTLWSGDARPLPTPEVVAPLSADQINYQAQLARSARIAAPTMRSRLKN